MCRYGRCYGSVSGSAWAPFARPRGAGGVTTDPAAQHLIRRIIENLKRLAHQRDEGVATPVATGAILPEAVMLLITENQKHFSVFDQEVANPSSPVTGKLRPLQLDSMPGLGALAADLPLIFEGAAP